MKRSQRGRLLVLSLVAMVVLGSTSALYVERFLRQWVEGSVTSELLREARLAREALLLAAPRPVPAEVDPLADKLGRASESRVTVVRADGLVLGDSGLDLEQVLRVENHAAREEIKQALSSPGDASGVGRRHSATVQQPLLYVAVPYSLGDSRGVVRLASPVSQMSQTLGKMRWTLFGAGALTMALLVFITGWQTHTASRALRSIVQSARGLAAGVGARRLAVTSDDELGRLAGSFNDLVDELQRTLQSLLAERDRLETILEGMTEAVLALDDADRVTHVNRAAIELLGLGSSPDGKPLIEVTRVPALAELMAQVHREGEATAEFEFEHSRRRRVLARAARVRLAGGTVLVMLDITEMRRLEQVRRDFVANVSHEIRTPVSVILANAETLRGGALDDAERAPGFLDAIVRNAERLSQLVSDLLDLSRIESGHYALEARDFDVVPVVHKMARAVGQLANAKAISITLDLPERLMANADPAALEQVLLNLLENAVKYTPSGGAIQVAGTLSDEAVECKVIDNGAGIEPRHRARIFERFYRVDPGRSREMGGTGLGLAIVKHLVGAMRGQVSVAAAADRGSVFRVRLPAAVAARARSSADAGDSGDSGLASAAGPGAPAEMG